MVTQALELSNQPHVVVATPGRLADHIRSSNTFNMSKIQFLVSSARTKREDLPMSQVHQALQFSAVYSDVDQNNLGRD